jgi:hypothetical protein
MVNVRAGNVSLAGAYFLVFLEICNPFWAVNTDGRNPGKINMVSYFIVNDSCSAFSHVVCGF